METFRYQIPFTSPNIQEGEKKPLDSELDDIHK